MKLEKIFSSCTYENEPITIIYKELLELNIQRTRNTMDGKMY
jgi:hypothetical protein